MTDKPLHEEETNNKLQGYDKPTINTFHDTFFYYSDAKVRRIMESRKRWLWEVKKAAICWNRIAAIGENNSC